jgi:hypothetical protein
VSLQALRCLLWQNMPGASVSPHQIVLSIDERAALLALIRPTGQARMLLRARIVVAAADGGTNAGIAGDLDVCADTVRKWRGRYARDRMPAAMLRQRADTVGLGPASGGDGVALPLPGCGRARGDRAPE